MIEARALHFVHQIDIVCPESRQITWLQVSRDFETTVEACFKANVKLPPLTASGFALGVIFNKAINKQIMKPSLKNYTSVLAVCAAFLTLETGCKAMGNLFSTTRYSESSYETAKLVKEKSLALIDKARARAAYAAFAKEDVSLMKDFDSAIASEQRRQKNEPTVAQWQTVKAEMRRFLDLWKKKEKLSPAFVDQEKKQVEKSFDTLLKTEQEKRHST